MHTHVAPCALAAFVFCKLGMDDQASAFAEECLLADQSRGGDTIPSTRIFGLMVRGKLRARQAVKADGKGVEDVSMAFDEAATIAERIGLRLYAVFALHAWLKFLREANIAQSSVDVQKVEARWSQLCEEMESSQEQLDELGNHVWCPLARGSSGERYATTK